MTPSLASSDRRHMHIDHQHNSNPPSCHLSLSLSHQHNYIYHHLLSTNKKCSPAYPNTKNTPQTNPNPATSSQSASTLNPKLLRIALPGTSMLRPYFLSTSER